MLNIFLQEFTINQGCVPEAEVVNVADGVNKKEKEVKKKKNQWLPFLS
jgi:hypothetical protein